MFLKKYSNAANVIIMLTGYLKIPVTPKTIVTELELHPNNPTLLSISDVLSQIGIINQAFNNISPDQLKIIPCPFIAYTKNEFVLVKAIDENNIHVNDDIITIGDFSKNFDGVILAIEPTEQAGDHNYALNKRQQLLDALRSPVAIIGLLSSLLLILHFHTTYFNTLNWQVFAITLFKGVGLGTSILLLIQSIDSNNPLIQILCQTDTNKNCNAILSSKAAKAFEWLTWSEIGFFYFAGTFLTVLFNSNSIAILQILAVLNLFSLPYTFYSIYYQARIAKQWCILCCSIQILLWLEFFPLVTSLTWPFISPNPVDLSGLLICFIIPFVLWIWTKPFLTGSQLIEPLNKQLHKFKYNIDLFNKLLTEQPKFVTPDTSWSFVLGNEENPDKIITMVSNPYCGPCNKAHEVINELLSTKTNIQVRFVFVFNDAGSEDDKRMLVARQLLALNAVHDKATIHKAMNNWYEQKQRNFPEWSKEYPATIDDSVTEKLKKHLDWLNLNEIRSTPTILIDGYKLPYPYELKDLKYF